MASVFSASGPMPCSRYRMVDTSSRVQMNITLYGLLKCGGHGSS